MTLVQLRPKDWAPDATQRATLESFEGYGSATPKVVFLGIDEHADEGDEHQRDNVYARCMSDEFRALRADKNTALARLYPDRKAEEVGVWRVAACIMGELRRALGQPKTSASIELTNLGTLGGDSLLTELLPLPRRCTKDFPPYMNDWWRYPSAGAYVRRTLGFDPGWSAARILAAAPSARIDFLRSLLKADPAPDFIVAYGVGWWKVHDAVFRPTERWTEVTKNGKGEATSRVTTLNGGVVLASTGFFESPPRALREKDVPDLVRGMLSARSTGLPN